MARRKKEPAGARRAAIAAGASAVFQEKGIASASMDDIAKAAGYSKATLYVYFENREAIVTYLVLESMKKLRDCLADALERGASTRERYDRICSALTRYEAEFPFYFQLALDKINVDFENTAYLPEEKETYLAGEAIREMLQAFLAEGVRKGELRGDLAIFPTLFAFWGMLSGVIQLSVKKEAYLRQAAGMTKGQFLQESFDLLYRSVAAREGEAV